jgi:hypothetical protein
MDWFEVVGYVASALVAVSLMMRRVIRLRIVNLVGAVLFALYGLLIGAVPILIVNVVIIGINVYFLWEIYRSRDYFTLLEVRPESAYLGRFLEFHSDDIARFLPDFAYRPMPGQIRRFVLRNMVPAGLLIADPADEAGILDVRLDYVIPSYRDYEAGRFIYSRGCELFGTHGYRSLRADAGTGGHAAYLARMGFRPARDRWVLDLAATAAR